MPSDDGLLWLGGGRTGERRFMRDAFDVARDFGELSDSVWLEFGPEEGSRMIAEAERIGRETVLSATDALATVRAAVRHGEPPEPETTEEAHARAVVAARVIEFYGWSEYYAARVAYAAVKEFTTADEALAVLTPRTNKPLEAQYPQGNRHERRAARKLAQ